MRRLTVVLLALAVFACAACERDKVTRPAASRASVERHTVNQDPNAPVGVATMLANGSLVLDLRADGPRGARGDARLVYSPDHPKYLDVLRHLGGLKPGESKPVPPWPE